MFLEKQVQQDVGELLREIALHYDMEVGEVSILSDHVHLTLSTTPRIAPARAVQILKSVSTRELLKKYKGLKQIYWGGEIWVQGYFVRSAGSGLTREQVEQYVREQSEEL